MTQQIQFIGFTPEDLKNLISEELKANVTAGDIMVDKAEREAGAKAMEILNQELTDQENIMDIEKLEEMLYTLRSTGTENLLEVVVELIEELKRDQSTN